MKTWTLVLCFSVVACGGKSGSTKSAADAAAQSGEPLLSVDQRIKQAVSLLTTGEPEHAKEALVDLQVLLSQLPDRADLAYNMGLAYHLMGETTNARKFYLRATQIDPALGEAWLNLGAVSVQEGQVQRALQHYRAGIQHAPEHGPLVVGLIGTLRRLGRYDEAIREAKAALSRDANNLDVYNNLGLVYVDQNKPDLALFIYQKALNTIAGAENNAMLHCNLGRAYLSKGESRRGNAREELERALELDPDLVPAMMYLAAFYMDNHDWDGSARLLEHAQAKDPLNPAIHNDLGITYRGLGQYDRSQQEYEKALDLDPGNLSPYLNLALLMGDHVKNYDAGIAAVQKYRTRGGPDRNRADRLLADLQQQKSKYESDLERKRSREEAGRKRDEEARLATEYEAMQEQWRKDEEAKQAAAAAAAAAAGAAATSGGGGSSTPPPTGTEAGSAMPATPGVGTSAAPPSTDVGAGSPDPAPSGGGAWGSPAAAPATPAAAPATPAAAPAAAPPPPPPPPPPEPRGSRQGGAPCDSTSQCLEGLECGTDGTCTDTAAARGSRQQGAPCNDDAQCLEGLRCAGGVCADGDAQPSNEGNRDWGGWQ